MTSGRNLLGSFALAACLTFVGSIVVAQNPPRDALPAQPSVKLTQEQRHVVREIILKDLKVNPQTANAPTKVGEVVPQGIALQPIPVEVSAKVPQVRTHSFYVKDNHVVLVDTKDNTVAEVVPSD